MNKEQLIREALCLPITAIAYHVSQQLADLFPDKALVEGGDGLFNVEEYTRAGHCQLEHQAIVYNQIITHWQGHEIGAFNMMHPMYRAMGLGDAIAPGQTEAEQELFDRSRNAWLTVEWRGSTFDIIVMNWPDNMRSIYHYWILADSAKTARSFLSEVCRWNSEVRGEVLVFDSGCWHKDARLFHAIKNSTFDNLILRGSLKQDIYDDLKQFFASRSTYETYGIPWKRGILFVGPPGNGKTHAVKAIINAMEQPCLYVKSLRAEHRTDEDNIRDVFERARKSAPCIVVLEDLDAILNNQNRSFFLNELDGFAANIGIVTLATTNHPERLDPAILDRPSRFDRKYPFDLPEHSERLAYVTLWNASLKSSLQLSEEAAARIAEQTDDFSFAYLKELFLSSMMRWIAKPDQDSFEQTMSSQVSILKEQMLSANSQPEPEPENDLQAMMPRMGAMGYRRTMRR